MIALGIVVGIGVIFGVLLVGFYNGLVRGKNQVEEAWSGISVQLKRRHDLILSLLNTVKGYAAHEKEVLVKLTEARAKAVSATAQVAGVNNVAAAENGLTAALRQLFAVAENYPELKANQNFLQMQESEAELEEEISMARRYYNGTAREQNNRVLQFPGNLIAGSFGFTKIDYFELDDKEDAKLPEIKF